MTDRPNPLAERLRRAATDMFDLLGLYLGERLGLYRSLAADGPATSVELAERTGTFERYVREWLEQQAVTGFLAVDDPAAEPGARRYHLPPEHVAVLVDQDSLDYEAHKGVDMVRGARPLPELVEAFRTGAALSPLPWQPDGRAEFNRARYVNLLGRRWLPAIPRVHDRLSSEPAARVGDLGCGTGWSSISMAAAYPSIVVEGFDLDDAAIAQARIHASTQGVADRVRFESANAIGLSGDDRYDLITVFEALHDMSRPVDVLRSMRSLLGPGGVALVADERVAERFIAPGDDRERYVYGWSVVSCLPTSMSEEGAAGTGAVMRASTMSRYGEEAGFASVEVLPIQDDQWRFYLLVP